MTKGFFESIDWLNREFKKLCCRIKALETGGAGLTSVDHDSTLQGDGTAGDPLRVTTPAPYFEVVAVGGNSYVSDLDNCTVDFRDDVNVIIVGNTYTVIGLCDVTIGTPGFKWGFQFSLPIATNNFTVNSDAIGTFASDGTAVKIMANIGTPKVLIKDELGTLTTTGTYTMHFTGKII